MADSSILLMMQHGRRFPSYRMFDCTFSLIRRYDSHVFLLLHCLFVWMHT